MNNSRKTKNVQEDRASKPQNNNRTGNSSQSNQDKNFQNNYSSDKTKKTTDKPEQKNYFRRSQNDENGYGNNSQRTTYRSTNQNSFGRFNNGQKTDNFGDRSQQARNNQSFSSNPRPYNRDIKQSFFERSQNNQETFQTREYKNPALSPRDSRHLNDMHKEFSIIQERANRNESLAISQRVTATKRSKKPKLWAKAKPSTRFKPATAPQGPATNSRRTISSQRAAAPKRRQGSKSTKAKKTTTSKPKSRTTNKRK